MTKKSPGAAKAAATVIRGGRLLDAARHRADPRDILIKGDSISEIGLPGMKVPAGTAEVKAQGRLLHPGLVNAHTHGHGNLAKGFGDRWPLELLMTAGPWINGNRTLEDKYLSTLIGAAEMVLKGCTACYDLTFEFPIPSVEGVQAAGQAYADVGMRAVVAPMVADLTFFQAIPGLMEVIPKRLRPGVEGTRLASSPKLLSALRKILKGWKLDSKSVEMAIAPTIPHHCRDELMVGCLRLAEEFGVALHSHVAESKVQAITGYRRYGKSLVAHLDDLGLLGPRFTAAHSIWLDDTDLKRFADQGASVAHNPGSNMRLGNGLIDMRRMLELGVNVGLGTDGAHCSDNQNMYEAMRLASFASKVRGPDFEKWVRTEEVVEAATEGSAKALGFADRVGRIAPGYKADIVFLDLGSINWIPCNDPTNQIVHTEDGSSVDSVMIGGRMIVENRKLLTVDLADLARKAEAARERLERLNKEKKALFERLAPVVGAYCPGLAKTPFHVHRYGAMTY